MPLSTIMIDNHLLVLPCLLWGSTESTVKHRSRRFEAVHSASVKDAIEGKGKSLGDGVGLGTAPALSPLPLEQRSTGSLLHAPAREATPLLP